MATAALLKAKFDEHQDYISMLVPFVLDAIQREARDTFTAEDVQLALGKHRGLAVALVPIHVALQRLRKGGYLDRRFGRYYPQPAIRFPPPIDAALHKEEEKYRYLASAFLAFAKERGTPLANEDDALLVLLSFLGDHDVAVLLDGEQLAIPVRHTTRQERLVARFVQSILARDDELRVSLVHLVQGFVLQNALLLRDIANVREGFGDLVVFLDTRCVLQAVGLEGAAPKAAIREMFQLLRASGVRLAVFEDTIEEIRRILRAHEVLASPSMQKDPLTSHTSALTRFLLTNRYTPASIRQEASLLELKLRELGVRRRQLPPHVREFTWDEAALTARLVSASGDETEPRVVHDVNCVAAVLTLRQNHRPQALENARAVFLTTNKHLVGDVSAWYRAQESQGELPVVHVTRLTNLAWLKKPGISSNLQVHQLAALCAAALRPSPKTWTSFLRYLKELRESGELKSVEAVAVLVSGFTDRLLESSEEEDGEPTADTFHEVLEQVRAEYTREADEKVRAAEEAASRNMEVTAALADREVAQARGKALSAEAALNHIVGRSKWIARNGARGISAAFGALLATGVLAALALETFSGTSAAVRHFGRGVPALLVVFAVLNFVNLYWGTPLRKVVRWLERRVERALHHFLTSESGRS